MAALGRLRMLRYRGVLRRGGSLPMVVDTDAGPFVAKLRGAGHGPAALVAEILATELARRAGLPVPGLVVLELLAASTGVNLGVEWLADARDLAADEARAAVTAELAANIVWLDAFLFNPDRTAASPNMMATDRGPTLIDFGSALLFHHQWSRAPALVHAPAPAVAEHLLLPVAGDLAAADRRMSARLDAPAIADAVAAVPDELLEAPICRLAYRTFLGERLAGPRTFVASAGRANQKPLRQGRPAWITRPR